MNIFHPLPNVKYLTKLKKSTYHYCNIKILRPSPTSSVFTINNPKKRFHAHIAVDDLTANIDFYSKLFGQAPSLVKDDYAKWMLDDPRVNFAISTRLQGRGLNHFGFQAETEEELTTLKQQADAAMNVDMPDPESETCCYAVSVKSWAIDPSGIPWEQNRDR